MSKTLKIGVTQRVDIAISADENRDALDQRLIDWIRRLDFIPVPIPNSLVDTCSPNNVQPNLDSWLKELSIDVILFSGGNDIGEIENRDLTEEYLLFWAQKHEKPVLGICRGMQMMGAYAGGDLELVGGHTRVRHQLIGSDLNIQLLPKSVNSYHNYALKQCPDGYEILAWSEGGSIEAIKHKTLSWEGWMWHPERESPYNNIDQLRFKRMVNDAN